MPFISVIIVNYNAGTLLQRCLQDLLAQDYQDFEVLLVDNASSDDSLTRVPDDDRITLIQLEENAGFAKANNIAAKQAKGAWLALLNPDAFPEKNWLSEFVTNTERYSNISMFGSMQLNANNPELLDGAGDMVFATGIPYRSLYQKPTTYAPTENYEVFAPCAAAAFYRKETFLNVGGFNEDFFCYCEDIDLAFRLRLQGESCIQLVHAIVHHKGSAVTGKLGNFARFYGNRNRLTFWYINMPYLLLLGLLPFHILQELLWLVYSTLRGHGITHLKAVGAFIKQFPQTWHTRQNIQKTRCVSNMECARWLVWSPLALFRRACKRLDD